MIILFTNKRSDQPKWEGDKLTKKTSFGLFVNLEPPDELTQNLLVNLIHFVWTKVKKTCNRRFQIMRV